MLTRTTGKNFTDTMSRHLSNMALKMQNLQSQGVTGLRHLRPSDDPTETHSIIRLRAQLADQEVFQENSELSMMYLSTAESSMSTASDIMNRLQEIVVQMASDTVTADDRATAATEVAGLKKALLDVANVEVDGRYIFSGNSFDTVPFDDTNTYFGDTNVPSIRISENRYMETGYDGSQVFQGGVDLFNLIDTIEADLLADNVGGLQNSLGDLENGLDQIIEVWQDIGHRFSFSEDALVMAETLEVQMNDNLSNRVAADVTKVYTELTEVQIAYEAALKVTVEGMNLSMFSYI